MSNRKAKRRRFRDQQKAAHQRRYAQQRQAFAAQIANLHPDRILYLTLDIGKNVHWMRAQTGAGREIHPSQKIVSTATGYEYWARCLLHYLHSKEFDLVVLGHEPTGIYHEPWCHHILNDFAAYLSAASHPQLLYRFINPYQTKLERQKLTQRADKSDAIDLRAIESLLQQGLGTPATRPDPLIALLHQHAYFARDAAQQVATLRRDLLRLIDLVWPGALVNVRRFTHAHPELPTPNPIVKSKPLDRQVLRFLLEHCPDPHTVRTLDVTELINLYHEHGFRCGPVTAQRVLDNARAALLNPPDMTQVHIQALQLRLQDEAYWRQRLQQAEADLEATAALTPARHLTSLRGITLLWAAYYLDIIGDPARFDWADQVWSYVGFDPVLHSSGDSQHVWHISKRGEKHHRNTLSWLACMVAGHHPLFGQHFIAAEERGKGLWGAAIHTAHKLHRTCFRLLRDDRPYVDTVAPADFPRWRTYWLAYRQHRAQPQSVPHPGPWKPATPYKNRANTFRVGTENIVV